MGGFYLQGRALLLLSTYFQPQEDCHPQTTKRKSTILTPQQTNASHHFESSKRAEDRSFGPFIKLGKYTERNMHKRKFGDFVAKGAGIRLCDLCLMDTIAFIVELDMWLSGSATNSNVAYYTNAATTTK